MVHVHHHDMVSGDSSKGMELQMATEVLLYFSRQ